MASPRPARLPMQPYRNLSGDSGVVAFALADDAVVLQFAQGDLYEYTAASAGPAALARMRALALGGRGLSTYVSQHVRDGYARKLPPGGPGLAR